MLDTLRRMFCDVRPFDFLMLVVEVLVLLLIAYEVGSGVWHRIRRHRRSKRVYQCFAEGQALRLNVPSEVAKDEEINMWKNRRTEWTNKTNEQLKKYSSQASASFVRAHIWPAGQHFLRVSPAIQLEYLTLREQLENLHAIMERPDVYF